VNPERLLLLPIDPQPVIHRSFFPRNPLSLFPLPSSPFLIFLFSRYLLSEAIILFPLVLSLTKFVKKHTSCVGGIHPASSLLFDSPNPPIHSLNFWVVPVPRFSSFFPSASVSIIVPSFSLVNCSSKVFRPPHDSVGSSSTLGAVPPFTSLAALSPASPSLFEERTLALSPFPSRLHYREPSDPHSASPFPSRARSLFCLLPLLLEQLCPPPFSLNDLCTEPSLSSILWVSFGHHDHNPLLKTLDLFSSLPHQYPLGAVNLNVNRLFFWFLSVEDLFPSLVCPIRHD